ncbi:DUF5405 family protein [Mycobacteriaceae bacterium NPDC060252]
MFNSTSCSRSSISTPYMSVIAEMPPRPESCISDVIAHLVAAPERLGTITSTDMRLNFATSVTRQCVIPM